MPYTPGNFDSEHLYVQWGGKLPGNEQWSCGLRMRKKTAGVVDSGSGLLVGVGAALVEFHSGANTKIASAAKLSFVKVNAIAVTGNYRDTAGTVQAVYADVAGGGGTVTHPNQVALVVSLLTGFSRGPAHKGRIFLPLPNIQMGSDGLISSTPAGEVSGQVDALLTNLNAVNSDYEVAVFSRKQGAAGHRKVTGNLVGRVLDTQRRRRRSLVEDYQ